MASVLEFNAAKKDKDAKSEEFDFKKSSKQETVTVYLISSSALTDDAICILDNFSNDGQFITILNPVSCVKKHDMPITVPELCIFNGYELEFTMNMNEHCLGSTVSISMSTLNFYTTPNREFVEAYLEMLEKYELIGKRVKKETT